MYVMLYFNSCSFPNIRNKQESESAKNDFMKPLLRVVSTDTETGMLPGVPGSAICVQKFDDSLILQFALRIAFRCVLHRCENLDIHR